MPVHQTGFTGEALVPCSHCNANDQGPEAGICHRAWGGANSIDDMSCGACLRAANDGKRVGITKTVLLAAAGGLHQLPCVHCEGTGYRRV